MHRKLAHNWSVQSRRVFFSKAGSGLAGMALSAMAAEGAKTSSDPLAPKKGHLVPKAKNVIWLFMEGGPSHIDLFDPKPKLNEMDGQ